MEMKYNFKAENQKDSNSSAEDIKSEWLLETLEELSTGKI